jgi:hypothetical protein
MTIAVAGSDLTLPWWKEPTKDQWLALVAAWLGWLLDGFDFTIFLLILVPIANEFEVSITAVAAVLTFTLWLRLVGAVGAGWLADRIGRKTADDIHSVVFGLQFHCRLFAEFRFLTRHTCRARHRYGRRVAHWGKSCHGIMAGAITRLHGSHFAGCLSTWICPLQRHLLVAL